MQGATCCAAREARHPILNDPPHLWMSSCAGDLHLCIGDTSLLSGNHSFKVLPGQEVTSGAGERRSKRVRRGEAEVKASSCNTLWDFKLRLVEALNIHPRNAEVHIRVGDAWQKLSNDEETLAGNGGSWTMLPEKKGQVQCHTAILCRKSERGLCIHDVMRAYEDLIVLLLSPHCSQCSIPRQRQCDHDDVQVYMCRAGAGPRAGCEGRACWPCERRRLCKHRGRASYCSNRQPGSGARICRDSPCRHSLCRPATIVSELANGTSLRSRESQAETSMLAALVSQHCSCLSAVCSLLADMCC